LGDAFSWQNLQVARRLPPGMNPHLLIILWLIWAAVCLAALVFIIIRRATWAALVDRENDFWVRRGWFSAAFAEKMKALEKGILPMLILGAIVLISVVQLWVLLHPAPPLKFKAMSPPPTPAPRRLPAH
jgi:hypothetical protein